MKKLILTLLLLVTEIFSFPLQSSAADKPSGPASDPELIAARDAASGKSAGDETAAEAAGVSDANAGEGTVRFLAVGDDLIHSPINDMALTAGNGSFDYNYLFDRVRDRIAEYDLAAINQETILIHDPALRSGYPRFGTPDVIGHAIAGAGFNIVTAAANHAMDKGMTGITDTLNFWKSEPDVTLLGLHETPEDSQSIDFVEKNGIRFALFDYTYGLNGLNLPAGQGWRVDLLSAKARLLADLQTAEQEADFSIVFIHMGKEYHYTPTAGQRALAAELAGAGADLIVGTHPHCVEPMETVTAANGNQAVVYYSLGNFIHVQQQPTTILGGAADVTITKRDGKTVISDHTFLPVICHREAGFTQPYFLSDYTDELAARHHFNYLGMPVSIPALYDLWHRITGL